jgi:chromosome segregation ATPase
MAPHSLTQFKSFLEHKMKKNTVTEFAVPSLADASPDYAALLDKQSELLAQQTELNREKGEIERQYAALPATAADVANERVAALLGEQPDGRPMLKKQHADIRAAIADVESALEIVRRRIADARDPASREVCAAVRPEYERRLAHMCKLLVEVEAARQSHDELLDDLDREDVSKASLRPVTPFFLGDRREGRIFSFLKESKEHGFNV